MHPIEESNLAGIGTRFSVRTRSGDVLIIVVRDSGNVEIYHAPEDDGEPEPVAILNEEEARHVAAIIGKTIYRPEAIERLARSGVVITWHVLQPGAFAIGKPLGVLEITDRTGASIISLVSKSGERRTPLEEDYILQEGDQAAVVGTQKETQACKELLDKGRG